MPEEILLPPSLLEAIRKGLSAPVSNGLTATQVCEKYLAWCKVNRALATYQKSAKHLPDFVASLPPNTPASEVRPFQVREWIDSHSTWGANQKRAVIAAITRPFKWAAEEGYPGCVPVPVKRPTATKRESSLNAESFAKLLGFLKEADPFRDLIVFAWEVGCRPQEARHIESRHLQLDKHRVQIPALEAKGKKRWRVIYLSPIAEQILKRLVEKNPTGKLFRNAKGTRWTVHSVNNRFRRLGKRSGLRFAAYDFRHAFATRKLKEGYDPITVANLLGHKDATMLCKHYEGISGDGEHLLNALKPHDPAK